MTENQAQHRGILQAIAHRAMLERGLLPELSAAAAAELDRILEPAKTDGSAARDLRSLLWCSIDNDDSEDLDQLTAAEALPAGRTRIFVAVADVDALVKNGSALDEQAGHNTTSVYTAGGNFPMLPVKLSTNLTSLNLDADRDAVAVEMVIAADGSLESSDIYPAVVRNRAKLAYRGVAGWLEGSGPLPEPAAAVSGLAENLRLQDQAAQKMKALRHAHGALTLETVEARPVFAGDELRDLETEYKNRATELIEDFMIAANGVTARYLSDQGYPSIRRVVRVPARWDRIVQLAAEHGSTLPAAPDSAALDRFLAKERAADPLRFPDLSLAVIKLLGSGEYLADAPGEPAPGHFGLAVKDYSHSTAPNRRYSDLITQRLLKAALAKAAWPYTRPDLDALAAHCTAQENAAEKVERQVGKSAAALLLQGRIGEEFDSLVTGAADKGTWVRLLSIPVEGKLVKGFEGVDVADRLRVRLIAVDVERGYIDFARVNSSGRH
ncbi:MAG: RNB domain-containing ribonuclease [Anaerolineae bacterium]